MLWYDRKQLSMLSISENNDDRRIILKAKNITKDQISHIAEGILNTRQLFCWFPCEFGFVFIYYILKIKDFTPAS